MATSSFDKTIVITRQAAETIAMRLDKSSITNTKQVKASSKVASKAMLAKRARLR